MSKKKKLFFKKSVAVSSIIPIDNIVEYWNMDGNANAFIDSANDCSSSVVTFQSGFINQGIGYAGGDSSYCMSPDSDIFSFGNGTTDSPFSLSLWVKINNVPNTRPNFIRKSGTSNMEWYFWFENTKVTCYLYSNGSTTVQKRGYKNYAIGDMVGVWTHVCMTYAGGSGVTNYPLVYINNDASSPLTIQVGTYVAMNNGSNNVSIGGKGGNSNYYLDGEVDEVAIFNKELSASEVADLYNGGLAGTPIIG